MQVKSLFIKPLLVIKILLCLFLSGRFRQVLLYPYIMCVDEYWHILLVHRAWGYYLTFRLL